MRGKKPCLFAFGAVSYTHLVDSLDALYARYYDVITAMDGKLEAGSAGKALIDAMKADVERIADKVPEEKKSFLFICTIDPYLATPDTVEGALLALIGTNAVSYTHLDVYKRQRQRIASLGICKAKHMRW